MKEKSFNFESNHSKIGVNDGLYKVTVRLQLIKKKKTKPPILGKFEFFIFQREHHGQTLWFRFDDKLWSLREHKLKFGSIFF